MSRGEELADEQRVLLELLPLEPPRRTDGRAHPWRGQRDGLGGVLWILRSGARWQDLPVHFPPYQTCHRHYQAWVRSGGWAGLSPSLPYSPRALRVGAQIDFDELQRAFR